MVFLELGWEDTTDFSISEDDLIRCVKFVHEARKKGGSVLIHCAQVKLFFLGDNDDDVSCDAVFEVILNDNKG